MSTLFILPVTESQCSIHKMRTPELKEDRAILLKLDNECFFCYTVDMVKLIYFSIRDYTSKKYIPPHQHAFWEFIQYLDIYGKTVISDSTYEFQPNTISIIPPNTIHDERNYSGGKIIAVGYENDYPFCPSAYTMPADPYILNLTKKMQAEFFSKKTYYKTLLECYLSDILIHILRDESNTSCHSPSALINDAISYIDEYFMTDIDFNVLARLTGYSSDHFRLLFKKETGLSPKHYVLEKRLELAKRLITSSDLTLTEIGTNCGFEYYSQFSLFFKQKTGLSPTQFKHKAFDQPTDERR